MVLSVGWLDHYKEGRVFFAIFHTAFTVMFIFFSVVYKMAKKSYF
jgi:hypothetical protein